MVCFWLSYRQPSSATTGTLDRNAERDFTIMGNIRNTPPTRSCLQAGFGYFHGDTVFCAVAPPSESAREGPVSGGYEPPRRHHRSIPRCDPHPGGMPTLRTFTSTQYATIPPESVPFRHPPLKPHPRNPDYAGSDIRFSSRLAASPPLCSGASLTQSQLRWRLNQVS